MEKGTDFAIMFAPSFAPGQTVMLGSCQSMSQQHDLIGPRETCTDVARGPAQTDIPWIENTHQLLINW